MDNRLVLQLIGLIIYSQGGELVVTDQHIHEFNPADWKLLEWYNSETGERVYKLERV